MSRRLPPALRQLIQQLKQRRVFRVAAIYVVGAFAIIQGADPVLDMAGAPQWVARVVLVLLAVGFVLAIALSWAFDMPDGVMRVKSTERETRGRSRSPVRPAYLGAGLLIASGIVAWFALRPERDAALDADAIAILPFDVAADPALGFLREGMVDLLAATLGSGAGVRAVDPRAAIAAWRRAASGEDGALTETAAFGVARRLGARRLLLGSAVGTAQHLIVNVRMYDVGRGGEPVRLSTEGSADSLTTIVDDLASQLLARDSRVPEHRLAALTTTSLPALRLYLDAVRNYRLGRCADATQQLTQALERDSTFALAAMQLLLCRGEGELTVELATGNRTTNLAWAARDRLSQRDRLILASLVGFRFPEPTPWHEAVEARERAVAANPIVRSCCSGWGIPFAWASCAATRLRRRARPSCTGTRLELDSTYAPVLRALARHAISTGDSATVRHLARRLLAVEPSGENADFMRWLAAAAAGDARELADVRATMMGMHPTALGWIALAAINYGVDLDGAEAALTALRVSARTRANASIPRGARSSCCTTAAVSPT